MSEYPPPDIAAKYPFHELDFRRYPEQEMIARGEELYADLRRRRSVRTFSSDPVPRAVIELAIRTASTAPSGAHRQPWTFVVIGDADTKRAIRAAAEDEERQNYEGGRIGPSWRDALERLGTTSDKSYLEVVPWIVVVFEQRYSFDEHGEQQHNYYVKESVGIASGMFIAALHRMGVATLTHTPSPMRFLTELLDRPDNERPFVLIPIGYPAPGSMVPDLARKGLDDVMVDFPRRR